MPFSKSCGSTNLFLGSLGNSRATKRGCCTHRYEWVCGLQKLRLPALHGLGGSMQFIRSWVQEDEKEERGCVRTARLVYMCGVNLDTRSLTPHNILTLAYVDFNDVPTAFQGLLIPIWWEISENRYNPPTPAEAGVRSYLSLHFDFFQSICLFLSMVWTRCSGLVT